MSTLNEIYAEFGKEYWIDNDQDFWSGSNKFKIVNVDKDYFYVEYVNGYKTKIIRNIKEADDYHIGEKI